VPFVPFLPCRQVRLGHGILVIWRRARFYRLTTAGRTRLQEEIAYGRQFSDVTALVLTAAPNDV
jgi:hypothetical protein